MIIYTALLILLAIRPDGGIDKIRSEPFETVAQCEAAKVDAAKEDDPPGYRIKAICLGSGTDPI